MEKSDIAAEITSATGPTIIPMTENVNGSDNTPPPTTVDTRLNTDVFRVAVLFMFVKQAAKIPISVKLVEPINGNQPLVNRPASPHLLVQRVKV